MYRERRSKRPLVALFILLLLGGGAYYVFGKSHSGAPAGAAGAGQMPPPTVTVQEIAAADLPLLFEYAGRTAGSREVEVRARVTGILLKRNYEEGSWVKQGQVLFTIDPAPLQAAYASAQAKAVQAEQDWGRAEGLYRERALSTREFDQARAAYEQYKADAQAARINLDYTTVTAPISGVTSKEGFSEGSLMTANTSLLTRITQLDPLYVEFAYPDAEAIQQREQLASGAMTLPKDKKLHAEIHFGDGSVYPQEGLINFTDSIIDPQTGSVRARVVLPNKDHSVYPGLFVRVVVKGFTLKNAIAVPDQAVMQSPQGPFVYVVDAEGKAAMQPVVLGLLNGNNRVISQGLKEGDRVITEGMIKARPGAPVNIAKPEDSATPPPATPVEEK